MKKLFALMLALVLAFCALAVAEEAPVAEEAAAVEEAVAEEAPAEAEPVDYAALVNPEGYPLVKIFFAAIPEITFEDVTEIDPAETTTEEIEMADQGADYAIILVTFGDVKIEDETAPEYIGFDHEEGDNIQALAIPADAEIVMPTDLIYDPVNTTKTMTVKEFVEWFENTMNTYYNDVVTDSNEDGIENFTVLASFSMNENGDVTRLEYVYMP